MIPSLVNSTTSNYDYYIYIHYILITISLSLPSCVQQQQFLASFVFHGKLFAQALPLC